MSATIDCQKDQAKIYEWARGEYSPADEDGNTEPINPIKFPLQDVNITVHGSRAVISITRPGQADLILDRLVRATIEQAGRGGSKTWTLAGQSERLYMANIDPADAGVTFGIKEWEAAVGSVSSGLA